MQEGHCAQPTLLSQGLKQEPDPAPSKEFKRRGETAAPKARALMVYPEQSAAHKLVYQTSDQKFIR